MEDIIKPASTVEATMKSIKAANTYVSGKISRGKCTLVTRLKWLTRLLVAVDSAVAKNVHGSSAQYQTAHTECPRWAPVRYARKSLCR